MGISHHGLELLKKYGIDRPMDVLELGCQHLYVTQTPEGPKKIWNEWAGPWTDKWFGWRRTSVDLTGCDDALEVDLRLPHDLGQFDVITNFGTLCYIHGREGFCQGYANAHNACRVGGLFVHETPEKGSWGRDVQQHVTKEFYEVLCRRMKYEIIDIGRHGAQGNTTNGWHVYCCLKKTADIPFMSFEEFDKLSFYRE